MASSEQKNLSLSKNNTSNLSAADTNELDINEDGDNNNDSEDFEEQEVIELKVSLQKMLKVQQMMI